MFVKSEMGPHSQGLTPATESVSLDEEEEVLIGINTAGRHIAVGGKTTIFSGKMFERLSIMMAARLITDHC